jgi:hypothetical protein
LYTTGWDIWPCPTSEFHAPFSTVLLPKPWMTAWPNTANVYRMDLNWTNILTGEGGDVHSQQEHYTFHMSNEIYPNAQWDFFPSQPPATTTNNTGSSGAATLKTRAFMWGTEARENWYLLDYDPAMRTMIIQFCAYTLDITGFDVMTMVLRKASDDEPFTNEMAKVIEQRAIDLLGERFGNLQRIQECSL